MKSLFDKLHLRKQPSGKLSGPPARPGDIGIVLSGGGTRAAYQIGALKALLPYLSANLESVSIVVGSSMGAVNGIILAACMKEGLDSAVHELETLWRARTYRNTFHGSPSRAFLKAIKVAILNYSSPGPGASSRSIFDPTPLIEAIDHTLMRHGGLHLETRSSSLSAVGVMTTIEGETRKPLLFVSTHDEMEPESLKGAAYDVCYVDSLSSRHGLASAALPHVLPAVDIDAEHGSVRLVDGGICENIPVDPAVRLGAHRVLILDTSGRQWWFDHYGEPHDTPQTWEVPSEVESYCLRPPETFASRTLEPVGVLLKEACGASTRDFIQALGPTWPIFTLIKRKLGEQLAYEIMSYVALHQGYIDALIDYGYRETKSLIEKHERLEFEQAETYEQWYESI